MESYSNSTNKLSCFFCLRSNSSRKYLNPQSESDLCGDDAGEAVSSFHEFSLRNLYRFLNLLHSDKEEKDFKHLKMPICENCFRVNGEFNKLYNLLEETKLRLNWCVGKLQDVLTKAGNEVKLVKVMKMEEEDDGDEEILEIWRAHTLDRMETFTRAQAQFPRVLLHKNEWKRPSTLIKDEGKISKMRMKDEMKLSPLKVEAMDQESCLNDGYGPEFGKIVETHSIVKMETYPDSPNPTPCSVNVENKENLKLEPRRKQVAKKATLLGKSSGMNLNKCTKCSYCGKKTGKPSYYKLHLVRSHPEHYFPEERDKASMSGITVEQFKGILKKILFVQFQSNPGSGSVASCTLCSARYTNNRNPSLLRGHLIKEHKEELKERIELLLKKGPLLLDELYSRTDNVTKK